MIHVMSVPEMILRRINGLFPLPVHPFNLRAEGRKSYAEWQFERALQTLEYFNDAADIEEMFKDNTVLDIGCGAGGKTLYYAMQKVRKIYGVDIVEKYIEEAKSLAKTKGVENIEFLITDEDRLPFECGFFDTIIVNDTFEHMKYPDRMLEECHRVLKPAGRLYISFPPYNHPYGAHVSDVIGIPWVHLLFSERTIINAYKRLVSVLPDGEERIRLRISKSESGGERISYINRMTIRKCRRCINKTPFNMVYFKLVPLRPFLQFCVYIPFLREYVCRMVVAVLEKQN